ncbi:hypothetical protein GCM10009539_35550 [Cryptosporangium japonicum]|uniref:Uncharacterized protein n=1 Tax=Cryptosporangium japonicum TaxID=80872 RepID=A0ABN0UDL2_9ACTN
MREAVAALAVAVGLAGCAPGFAPGAAGIGDPYFPTAGNGGYDVAGYDLDLRYDPSTGVLSGAATITATATRALSRFHLDLAALTASTVTVDGAAAGHSAQGGELVVTPPDGLERGRRFTTVVTYSVRRVRRTGTRTAAGSAPRRAPTRSASRGRRARGTR